MNTIISKFSPDDKEFEEGISKKITYLDDNGRTVKDEFIFTEEYARTEGVSVGIDYFDSDGRKVKQEAVFTDEYAKDGLSRFIVYFEADENTVIKTERYATESFTEQNGTTMDVIYFDSTGKEIRKENYSSSKYAKQSGKSKIIEYFGDDGKTQKIECLYTEEYSKNSGVSVHTSYLDHNGKLIYKDAYFTAEHAEKHGHFKYITYYDDHGVSQMQETYFTDKYAAETGRKKGIVYSDSAGNDVKTEIYFTDESAANNGLSVETTYFDLDGKPTRREAFFTDRYSREMGLLKRIIHLDSGGKAIREEIYYTDECARKEGYWKMILYFNRSEGGTKREWLCTDEFTGKSGTSKVIEDFDSNGNLISTERFAHNGEIIYCHKADQEEKDAQKVSEAIAALMQNDFSKARYLLKQVIANTPDKYVYQYEKDGVVHIKFWDEKECLQYKTWLDRHYGDRSVVWVQCAYPRAYFYLGYMDIQEEKYESSLAYLQASLRLEPDQPNILTEMALAYGQIGEHGKAILLLDQALESRVWTSASKKARILRGKGVQLIELNDLEQAKACFTESLKYEPGNEIALSELIYIGELKAGGASRRPIDLVHNNPERRCVQCGKNLTNAHYNEFKVMNVEDNLVYVCSVCAIDPKYGKALAVEGKADFSKREKDV